MTDETVIRTSNELAGICSCMWHGDQREPGIDCPVHPKPSPSKDRFRKFEGNIPWELLPCRLCGFPAELWQRWVRDDIWCSFGACTNLEDVDGECCTFHLPDSGHFYCERKSEAVRYWNLMMGPRGSNETLQPASNERLSDTNLRNIRSWAENHLEFSSDDSGPRMIAEAMDELLMRRRAAETNSCAPDSKEAISADLEKVQCENDLLEWRAERAIDLLEDAPGAARETLCGNYDYEFHSRSSKANSVETLPKLWTMGGDLNGTHLVGYANVLYSRIVEVFGEPTETDFSEGSRVVFNWTITFVDGTIASIYEYKSSSLYGDGDDAPTPEEMKKTFMDWHIGGKSQRAVELVTNALSEEVR